MKAIPEVVSVFVDGGRQAPSKREVRVAGLTVVLTPKDRRTRTQAQVEGELFAVLRDQPDLRFWAVRDNGQRDLALVFGGRDQAAVTRSADALRREMAGIPHLVNVISTAPIDRTEIRVDPRSAIAADLGVSTPALAATVRVGTIGDIGANLAKFTEGERQVPIRVQLPDASRGDLDALRNLRVPLSYGGSVPLSAVAELKLARGPTAIERYDRSLRVAVEAAMQGSDALGDLLAKALALPAAKNLPDGVTLSQTGDAEIMNEVFSGFALAMGTGLMMVLAVLVLLFGSVAQPLTILFSLPLSVGGAILGLLVTNRPISMPVIIGILMLMGVVTKNAIMLVDLALEEMAAGVDRVSAIIDSGRKRARPIVMTTIAMAAGMVPSALAYVPRAVQQASMRRWTPASVRRQSSLRGRPGPASGDLAAGGAPDRLGAQDQLPAFRRQADLQLADARVAAGDGLGREGARGRQALGRGDDQRRREAGGVGQRRPPVGVAADAQGTLGEVEVGAKAQVGIGGRR